MSDQQKKTQAQVTTTLPKKQKRSVEEKLKAQQQALGWGFEMFKQAQKQKAQQQAQEKALRVGKIGKLLTQIEKINKDNFIIIPGTKISKELSEKKAELKDAINKRRTELDEKIQSTRRKTGLSQYSKNQLINEIQSQKLTLGLQSKIHKPIGIPLNIVNKYKKEIINLQTELKKKQQQKEDKKTTETDRKKLEKQIDELNKKIVKEYNNVLKDVEKAKRSPKPFTGSIQQVSKIKNLYKDIDETMRKKEDLLRLKNRPSKDLTQDQKQRLDDVEQKLKKYDQVIKKLQQDIETLSKADNQITQLDKNINQAKKQLETYQQRLKIQVDVKQPATPEQIQSTNKKLTELKNKISNLITKKQQVIKARKQAQAPFKSKIQKALLDPVLQIKQIEKEIEPLKQKIGKYELKQSAEKLTLSQAESRDKEFSIIRLKQLVERKKELQQKAKSKPVILPSFPTPEIWSSVRRLVSKFPTTSRQDVAKMSQGNLIKHIQQQLTLLKTLKQSMKTETDNEKIRAEQEKYKNDLTKLIELITKEKQTVTSTHGTEYLDEIITNLKTILEKFKPLLPQNDTQVLKPQQQVVPSTSDDWKIQTQYA